MRTMTKESARLYIQAGYFPKPTEIEAICDLQDVFGHLPYRFVIRLLAEENNATELYELIWNKEDVERYLHEATDYINAVESVKRLEKELEEARKIVKRYDI